MYRRAYASPSSAPSTLWAALLLLIPVVLVACKAKEADAGTPSPEQVATQVPENDQVSIEISTRQLRRFHSLAPRDDHTAVVTRPKVELGRLLYFDPRLSRSQQISCNTCHPLDRYGADGKARSSGHGGKLGRRNTPTTLNAANHFALFWDGRAATIEEQAVGPILDPNEMANSEARVLATLRSMPAYAAAFAEAFPDDRPAISLANVGRALGAFERQLLTPSRWDRFLAGEAGALKPEEKAGLKVFLSSGCMVCHTGPQVGASMFQKAGAVEPWPNESDLGRFEVTRHPADRMMFKVPGLRNVAETAPYFHDGSAATLPEAIRRMGQHQLGIDLRDADVVLIAKWFDSLTGELPKELAQPPSLPPSTRQTPAPEAG